MAKKKTAARPQRGITSYRPAPEAAWVDLDGQRVPSRFYVETTVDYEWVDMDEHDEDGSPVFIPEGRHRPYERITYVIEDGVLDVEAYEARRWPGLSLNDTALRDRGLTSLGARAVDALAKGPGGLQGQMDRELGLATEQEQEREAALGKVRFAGQGRPSVSDEQVRQAAQVYLDAERAGHPPAQAVADELGLSRAQTQLRLKRARELGYLPPYIRGGKK